MLKLKNLLKELSEAQLNIVYIDNLFKAIRNKRIYGWKPELEGMSGVWRWNNPAFGHIFVHATPFWEGTEGVQIQVTDNSGNYELSRLFPLKLSGDLRKDAQEYIAIVEKWFRENLKKLKKWEAEERIKK